MMMAAPFFAIGMMTMLAGGSSIMGLPPAERDAKLVNAAPATSILYTEWASRSTGKPGAKGIDGLAADPEIRLFLTSVKRAILSAVEKETARGGPEEKTLAKHLPPLIEILLMRSGCVAVDFDPKAAAEAMKAAEGRMRNAAVLAGAKAILVVNGGGKSDEIAEHVSGLLELLPGGGRGLDKRTIPLPGAPPFISLMVHREGDYFIVGFGAGSVDAAIAGLKGKSRGLAENERFVAAMKKVGFERTANMTYLDVQSGVERASAVFGKMVEAAVKMVGADSIHSFASATGVIDGQIRSRTFIATDGSTDGVLALASGRAIKPADFARVPADSDLVFALSLNVPDILKEVRKIIRTADAGAATEFDEVIAKVEREVGVKLKDDVFQAFGDVWVFHDSRAAGGLLVTSLVGSLEVKDPKKAYEVFTQLMTVLDKALPGDMRPGERRQRGVFLSQAKFMDRTVYYVNTVGDDVPFAPAFCVTDKELLVAPHPQALKAHLRFLAEADRGTATGRRATFATVLKQRIPFPESGEVICASYADVKTVVHHLYAIVPYFAQLAYSELQRERIPIDIFSLPSARGILPYVGDAWSTVTRTPKGIRIDAAQPLPNPYAGVAPLLPFVLWGTARVERGRAIERIERDKRDIERERDKREFERRKRLDRLDRLKLMQRQLHRVRSIAASMRRSNVA